MNFDEVAGEVVSGWRGIGLRVIRVYCLYTHLSAILNEATVFCVTGGHRG